MISLAACVLSFVMPLDDPPVVVNQYEIQLAVHPGSRAVRGTAHVLVEATEDGVEELVVSLGSRLSLDVVKDRDGSVIGFSGDVEMAMRKLGPRAGGQGYALQFRPPVDEGETRRLVFEYRGEGVDPGPTSPDRTSVLVVRPDEIRMNCRARWYPAVPRDEGASSILPAPMRLELQLPAGMHSLGPGRLVKTSKRGGVRIHTWESERPVQASILAGAYEAHEVKSGKKGLRILAFPEHAEGAAKWATEAEKAIEVFERRFGKLRDAQYGIAEMRVKYRAMSHDYEAEGFSVFDSALFDGRDPDPRRVAHAAAHLWWGRHVDPAGTAERFLTDSLAELSALVFLETEYGEEAATEAARACIERALAAEVASQPIVEATYTRHRDSAVIDDKGAMVLRTLRSWMGAEEFDQALRKWAKKYGKRRAIPDLDDFLDVFREQDEGILDVWADEWLRRTELPAYRVQFTSNRGVDGAVLLTGELHQDTPVFHNPVELELRIRGGIRQLLVVTPEAATTPFEASVSDDVDSIVVDPRAFVLARPK